MKNSTSLKTGSRVIDRLCTLASLKTGQVLHLFGCEEGAQEYISLQICHAACQRGERSVFINLAESLDMNLVQNIGLSSFFDEKTPGSVLQPFCLISFEPGLDLRAIIHLVSTRIRGKRATIVVNRLERAFESSSHPLPPEQAKAALSTLREMVEEFKLLCHETDTTLWLGHSCGVSAPLFDRPGVGPRNPPLFTMFLNRDGQLMEKRAKKRGTHHQSKLSPFQRGIVPLLMSSQRVVESQSAGKGLRHLGVEGNNLVDEGGNESGGAPRIPSLFGLEVSFYYSTGGAGTGQPIRGERQVQLWNGNEPVGGFEWLPLTMDFLFDNKAERWSPGLSTSRSKPVPFVPKILGGQAMPKVQGTPGVQRTPEQQRKQKSQRFPKREQKRVRRWWD